MQNAAFWASESDAGSKLTGKAKWILIRDRPYTEVGVIQFLAKDVCRWNSVEFRAFLTDDRQHRIEFNWVFQLFSSFKFTIVCQSVCLCAFYNVCLSVNKPSVCLVSLLSVCLSLFFFSRQMLFCWSKQRNKKEQSFFSKNLRNKTGPLNATIPVFRIHGLFTSTRPTISCRHVWFSEAQSGLQWHK